eukprot:4828919-Pyramimonas_sp.AAC.1
MPTVVFFRRVSACSRISLLLFLPRASVHILLVVGAGEERGGGGGRESGGRQERFSVRALRSGASRSCPS